MKRLIFVLAVGLALCALPGFERVIGGPNEDRGVFVSPTADGGFVAIGSTRSYGHGEEDLYVVRTDKAGELEWTRTYGGAQTEYGWSIHEAGDGLILAGSTASFGAGDFDCYLLRTNATGDELWSKTIGGEGRDRCWGMLVLDDGGFILVGETTSYGSGAEDCYLVRTDGSGNEMWSNVFGGEQGDRCFSVALTDMGGFVLAGQTFSEGEGDRDAWVIGTDSSGDLRWSRTFGGPESDVAHYVARTTEGDFFVTGYTTSLADEDDDPYVIRIDGDGRVVWSRVIPMTGVNHTITGEQTTDGGFITCGFTEAGEDGANSGLLMKTDSDGNLLWSRDLLPTTMGRSTCYTVRAIPDGGAILTGHTTERAQGGLDLLLVRVDSDGR